MVLLPSGLVYRRGWFRTGLSAKGPAEYCLTEHDEVQGSSEEQDADGHDREDVLGTYGRTGTLLGIGLEVTQVTLGQRLWKAVFESGGLTRRNLKVI